MRERARVSPFFELKKHIDKKNIFRIFFYFWILWPKMKLGSKFQKNISIFKVPVNFENSKTRHAIDMCPSVNVGFFVDLGSEILNLDLVK